MNRTRAQHRPNEALTMSRTRPERRLRSAPTLGAARASSAFHPAPEHPHVMLQSVPKSRRRTAAPARLSLTLVAVLAACGGSAPPPAATVGLVEPVRGAVTLSREGHDTTARAPARVETGATLATPEGARATFTHDAGPWFLLDRGTRMSVTLGGVNVLSGRVFVDARVDQGLDVESPSGTVSVQNGAMAVQVTAERTEVYCASGEVVYRASGGEGRIAQGETLVLTASAAEVAPAALWDDWTGGLADPSPRPPPEAGYIGQLAGRRLDERGVARRPLSMRSHEVQVSLDGELARTEVVQTFFNGYDDALEAEYRLRLPEGAVVEGFEVDQGAGFVASAVEQLPMGDGYTLPYVPPHMASARLSYDGPQRVRARVYPVSPGEVVRVKVAYTQWLMRTGGTRTYVYPMRASGEPPLVGELHLAVDLGASSGATTRAGMGALTEGGRVVLRRSDFRPRADFTLDIMDPAETTEVAQAPHIYTYRAQTGELDPLTGERMPDETFVAVDIPTHDLAPTGEEVPLSLVLLVDTSGGTEPEELELARGVVEHVLQQLAPTDRVALRFGDLVTRAPEGDAGGLAEASSEHGERLLSALGTAQLGGATDLGTMLRGAAGALEGAPRAAVLYLGDGRPTTGALDATSIRAALDSLPRAPRFFALGLGDDANIDLLRAVMGTSSARTVHAREDLAGAVLATLTDAARPMLRGVEVDLGEGVERVYPRGRLTVPDSGRLRLFGRLVDDVPTTVRVRGARDGVEFDQTLELSASSVTAPDIRRRWASARLDELLDENAGREALVAIGLTYDLLTPWNALVVGGGKGHTFGLVQDFDLNPLEFSWHLGGRGPSVHAEDAGWRRRAAAASPVVETQAAERTWVPRVSSGASAGEAEPAPTTDGGYAQAAVGRVLRQGARGPNACYERKLLVRPDLEGSVTVAVSVDGTGAVESATLVRSTLDESDVDLCVVQEVRGLRFPNTEGRTIRVEHTYVFNAPDRAIGTRRTCSDASRQDLAVRRNLWRERLAASGGVGGALSVYREALGQCELGDFRARRVLLDMMLAHVGAQRVQLAAAFSANSAAGSYLRAVVLRSLGSAREVELARRLLGLDDQNIDWSVFDRLYRRAGSPAAKLRLVRRWLEIAPDELDLRLRLLQLLEETNNLPEARRLAWALRADPLADAAVRTAVGEFWLRQERPDEARRVFSEIVERAPLDPWARRRLGDLYRAHAWPDDAYREYRALAQLRQGDEEVFLLLARAAADAGRVDEALRLEQRVAEAADGAADEGAAAVAQAWTRVRLALLRAEANDPALDAAVLRRQRHSGALRSPPALFAALTWAHPDDVLQMTVAYPDAPERFEPVQLNGQTHGIHALTLADLDEGALRLAFARDEREELRPTDATLVVVLGLGTDGERILRETVHLDRDTRRLVMRLEGGALTREPASAASTAR
ncbi:MAG: AgmX/PglI C-terminal domain-containing protein [Sandaracinaceae bacterium]|nr:AgmX/PglI C-terminal domain-containing protein [Sandaracinaceae bacterium]